MAGIRKIVFFGAKKPLSSLNRLLVKKTLDQICKDHSLKIKRLSYVLIDDESLLEINQTHLQHNTYTDIITFDLSETPKTVEGEIFISWERVEENSRKYGTEQEELLRVVFHGALHLCGYGDKTPTEQKLMREKEDQYITLYREMAKKAAVSRETK